MLQGKRIAVTGASGALGTVVLQALATAGASAAGIPRGTDLSDASVAAVALRTIAQKLGGLDALVNVAGGFGFGKLADGGAEPWELMHKSNLMTAVNATQAALPLLGANGRIIYIGSASAAKAGVGMGPYAASKAGIEKLTEALAAEVKDRTITVNAILPSIIDTPANRADMPKADFSRWVQPQQIADLIVFLLSERASAITGALIPIVGRV
ncbi:MAG TPA: SDR family oxidoreductase [Steroidobacteraceae bacterium]|nr:SDR family oxidoreductase [Steroidobacteraceae bacterium]HJY41514.1 SDR family oxidoreductase [Steroidobacteraceae bacterium]